MTTLIDREEKSQYILPAIKGMNTKDPPHHLPDGQGLDLYNVEIDEVIGIDKRNGFTPFNTASVLIPRYAVGTVKEITGAMVYFSGTTLTASVCKGSDVIYVLGNSSPVFWQIETMVGAATASLYTSYTQTVTNSTYILGPREVGSLHNFKYGTTQKLLAFAGSNGFVATAGTTGTFTAITAALTDYAKVEGVTFQDKFYFCNGYEFKYYDGSNVTPMSGSPAPSDPRFICVYTIGNANYLCIAGSNTDASKSKFAFSDVNAPATWPSDNVYYVGDRDGAVITGVKPIPGGVAILKENSIFVFSGIPGSGTLRKVSEDVGCVSPYSLVEYKGALYFVGKRSGKLGVYVFDGTPNVICLSDAIEPTLAALDQASNAKITAKIYNNKYVLSATGASGTYNNCHFECYITRPFANGENIYFPWVRGDRAWNTLVNTEVSGTNYLFSGSPTNGLVYREDTGTADDTIDNIFGNTSAINAYVDSAWYSFGDISRRKELLCSYLDITESGDWVVKLRLYRDFQSYGYDSYDVDLGATIMIWSDIVYLKTVWQTAVDKSVKKIEFNYPSYAKFFKFRWLNANADQPFSVYPMQINYKLDVR